jgi:hypothetical protein
MTSSGHVFRASGSIRPQRGTAGAGGVIAQANASNLVVERTSDKCAGDIERVVQDNGQIAGVRQGRK